MVVESTPPQTIAEVARELGVNEASLRSWVKRYLKRRDEERVAEFVKKAVALYDGRDLGGRTSRDGQDRSGLRVDFTYDDAEIRPVAMEITVLDEPKQRPVRALGAELLELETELQEFVSSEKLGEWWLGIRVGASKQDIKEPLKELLRRHRGRKGAAIFAADKAPEDTTDDDRQLRDELVRPGLVAAVHRDEGNGLSIFPPVSDAQEGDGDFGVLLEEAMRCNLDKLREAKAWKAHLEAHLVVWLDHFDLSPDPVCTPAPELPDGIDVLWILLGYYNAKTTYRLWRTTASDRRWLRLWHPLGKSPAVCPPYAAS